MRRLLLLLCLTLAMAIPTMAESAVLISCPFVKSGMEPVSSYGSTWTFTSGNYTWTIKNFNNNNASWDYIKCGTKNNASIASIATDFAIPEGVDKIQVTIDDVTANDVNSVYLQIAENADFTNPTTIGPDASIAKGILTYTIANPKAKQYYNLVFDCKKKNSKSNGSIQISKVEYYGNAAPSKEPNGLNFGNDADVTVYKGATEINYPELDNPYELAVTYESSKPEVATIDAISGAIAIVAAGVTTISATTTGNDTYAAGSVSYTLKVIDANVKVSAGYKLLTDLKDLANGTKGIIVNSDYALGAITGSNKYCNAVNVTIKDNFIEDAGTASVVTFVKNDAGKYALKIGDQYLVGNGKSDNTTVKYQTAASYGTITLNSIQLGNSHSERYLGFNSSATPKRFANYKTASENINSTQIFIETEAQSYEAPAAIDATFEGNSSLEGENLYIVAGENVTVTLPVPEGVLAYYYINDDATMIRYTAPFEVSAGDIVGYYTEQYGLKSEEKMFEVKSIDFSGIAPELKGFNGEHAVMVSFDLTGFDGSVWYKFNDAATAAPALVTPAEEGYTKYAEPFKIAAVGTLTYKAESHGLMSAPVEKSITGEDLTTGVENVIVTDDSEAAYYDLNGRRVINPAAGIYIRIAGGKATKAIIR